jgi:hypothetical protein
MGSERTYEHAFGAFGGLMVALGSRGLCVFRREWSETILSILSGV